MLSLLRAVNDRWTTRFSQTMSLPDKDCVQSVALFWTLRRCGQ